MRSEWINVRLGDVAKVVTKGTTPTTVGYEFKTSGINFVKSESITFDGWIDRTKFAFIDPDAHTALKRSQLLEGDILFSMAGVYIGKTAVVPKDILPANTNQAVGIIRLDQTKAFPRFVDYYLRNPSYNRFLNNLVAQSAQPNLNLAEIKNLPLTLPPIHEQRKVCTVLATIDDRITLLRETNATLEAIAQALFKSWFVDFDPVHAKQQGRTPEGMDDATAAFFPDSFDESELGFIPKGWRIANVGEVSAQIFSGGTPDTRKPEYWSGDIPWFSSGETRSRVIIDTEKRINQLAIQNSSTKMSLPSDVLIASAGQGHTRGQTSYNAITAYINQSVVALRANQEVCEPLWLYYNLSRRYEEMRNLSDSHSSRGSLTTKLLAGMRAIVPYRAVGTAFADVVSALMKSQVTNEQQAQTLATLRDTLLPRLISGQLRLPEAQRELDEAMA